MPDIFGWHCREHILDPWGDMGALDCQLGCYYCGACHAHFYRDVLVTARGNIQSTTRLVAHLVQRHVYFFTRFTSALIVT